jgi:dolichyl-phosphate-mannose-protein mannosyltransferase
MFQERNGDASAIQFSSSLRWVWRWLCAGVCFLSGIPAYTSAAVPSSRESPTISIPGSGGLGEVAQYTAEGQLVRRWTGLSDIQSVHVSSQGRLAVLEHGNHQLLEFDPSGTVLRSLSLPQANVFDGTILSNGHLLLAAGREGLVELDTSGVVVWRSPPPEGVTEVVAAARLADGTTVCAARPSETWLYEVPAGSARMSPIVLPGIGPLTDLWQRPKLRVLGSAAQEAALWYEPWSNWFKLIWSGGVLQTHLGFPARGAVRAISGARDGMVWAAQAQFEVVRLLPSGKEAGWFAVADEIRDIAAGDGSVFVATERIPDAVKAAHRPASPGHQPFLWLRLGVWVLGSVLLIGILQIATWRNANYDRPLAVNRVTPAPDPSTSGIRLHREGWIACVAATVVGLGLTGFGCARLYQQGYRQAIPLLVGGALLVAIAGHWWSRVVCGGGDRWWLEVRTARYPRRLVLPTLCIVVVLIAGGALLWRWRSAGQHYNASVSLWVFLQLLCVGLLTFSASRFQIRGSKIPWETIVHVAGLLLLASVCLGVDLGTVPQNVHGDVGLTVDYALRLLEGRVDNLFSGGYAEIPYPGHLLTSLGLLIAGKTVIGSRWGAMLMGLAAVLGTYALGREYKSARLGLFASILLLASVPFLHFSRSTPFGEVAAYSVWLLYFLLRAVRTASPGAWLVCGVVGGWGLFLFYSARVALVSVVVAGILLALRSLRVTLRRWYGPLLFVLAFAITIIPMVPYWRSHPGAFSHRMDTSFSLYDPHTGFHGEVLARAMGKPFLKTLGMFYNERDESGQGTLSPAAGPIEATLLSIGLVVVMTDGWGANVACLGWFVMMLLGCGAFAEATPWYTRLVPVTPVVSLFMARAIDLQLDLIPLKRSHWRWMLTAVVSVALIGGVVAKNLATYLHYERTQPASEFTAFGRAALALGPQYQFYCVTFQRPDFSCLNGSFVPYLATLDVRDLRDPLRAMPFSAARPAAIMVPFTRFTPRSLDPKTIVNSMLARYHEAKLRYVYSDQAAHSLLGVIVVIPP